MGAGPGLFDRTAGILRVRGHRRAGCRRFGWAGGFGTSWLADPARDLTVIAWRNDVRDPESPPVHRDLQARAAGPA